MLTTLRHPPIVGVALATAGLLLVGCGRDRGEITRDSLAGECTITEPGTPSIRGIAAYVEHVTPTAGGGFGVGSLAVTITCASTGLAPEQVILILPNLSRGRPIPLGEYRIRDPGDSLTTQTALADPRLAWARLRRGGEAPLLFSGDGGRVIVTRASEGVLEGAYQVAIAASDTAVSLRGARGEVDGDPRGVPTDSAGATVIGGAFAAPAKQADWRGELPR